MGTRMRTLAVLISVVVLMGSVPHGMAQPPERPRPIPPAPIPAPSPEPLPPSPIPPPKPEPIPPAPTRPPN